MSRAFVRETEGDALGALPDRPISPHPNFVTSAGLAKIEARLGELASTRAAALMADDRTALAGIDRELRYWKQRRSSARIIAAPAAPAIVRFGVTVSLRFDDGGQQHFQLVGEDEAQPASGLVSWTSPVGSALIGRRAGERVEVGGRQAEIVAMHS